MWREFLISGTFWGSAARSYVVNLVFGISVNVALNWGKAAIPFLDGFHGDMAAAFASSAFFCGLFTPLFSSCFIRRKVQRGAIRAPDAAVVAQSWLACFLRQGACARSCILALLDLVVFGTATVVAGGLVSSTLKPEPCELEVWAFLVVLVVWCVPVQVFTSLLNYVAAANCSRRPDASPLASGEGDLEGSLAAPADAANNNEQYLMAAVKMSASEVAEFPAFFSKVNPDVHQRYKDLCKENNTLDEYMANPLVFILANNPQCCSHIAREYVDVRSPTSKNDTPSTTADIRTEGSFTSGMFSSPTSVTHSERSAAADGQHPQLPQIAKAG